MSNEYITLLNGDRWYFDGHAPLNAPIGDMLIALDHIGRFTGQTCVFYSVLQHSLNAYRVACELTKNRDERRAALVHDVHECLVGDVSSPMKRWMAGSLQLAEDSRYKQAEYKAKKAVAWRFHVPVDDSDVVKEVDHHCLVAEAVYLQPQCGDKEWQQMPLSNGMVVDVRNEASIWIREKLFDRKPTADLIQQFRDALWECT
jgi:hypothetical protein